MIQVKDSVYPSPEQWKIIVHGMRNAFKSWDKSDSQLIEFDIGGCDPFNIEGYVNDEYVDYVEAVKAYDSKDTDMVSEYLFEGYYKLGKNDKRLLTMLTKLGTSDRKVLRQLPIIMEITAPEYWWRQFDTYKVGTVANSTSQMHTLLKKPFERSDFSLEIFEYQDVVDGGVNDEYEDSAEIESFIDHLNYLRDEYLLNGRKEAWYRILERIPQSFNYTRTVSFNYEVALTIIRQRMFHDLPEWTELIIFMLQDIPFLKELAIADGTIEIIEDQVFGVQGDHKQLLYKIEEINWKPAWMKIPSELTQDQE